MTDHTLPAHMARFAAALRARGVRVGLSDEVDAVTALSLVDVLDRDEVRRALSTALKIQPRDRAAFDELFHRFFAVAADRPTGSSTHRAGSPAPKPTGAPSGDRGDRNSEAADGTKPGYSPERLLRRRPFDECSATDLAAMERLLARLSLKLATRRSRRLVPSPERGLVDLRRSLRRAVGTRGELFWLARRTRALETPRLVVLCDTSGSMDPHTRFLLTFILSLKRVARRTEVFAFNTTLTRLTPWLATGKVTLTLDRLAAGVPDWSGGTRIGASLAEFVARHQDELVNRDTVVVILSDGLDRGDVGELAEAMRAIHRRARKVIWLNPLLGDPRYQPLARGMAAALPFIDHLASAHNLESLERLLTLVAA